MSERIKRPEPERTQPIRNMSTVFGAPARSTPPGAGRDSPRAAAADPVSRGVEAGYRVIDEYMRQGQSVARTMWGPFMPGGAAQGPWSPWAGWAGEAPQGPGPRPGAPFPGAPFPGAPSPDEVQQRMGTMMRYATDLAMMWMDFLGMGGMAGYGPRPPSGPAPGAVDVGPFSAGGEPHAHPEPPRAHQGREAPEPEQTIISVEIASSRRTEVSVDLRPRSAGLPLKVHDLRSTEPDHPRLGGVGIQGLAAEDRVIVRIEVPDELPPGVYSGLILDELSSLPRGTLSVRVSAP
jgi:hypothetical protein